MIRFLLGLILLAVLVIGGAMAFGLLKVEQTQDARLPAVAVQKGTLPSYKADVVQVDVGTRNEVVEVPTIDINKPK